MEDVNDRSVTKCHGPSVIRTKSFFSVGELFFKLYSKMYLRDCSAFFSRPLQFNVDEFSPFQWEAHEMKSDGFYLGICTQLWRFILQKIPRLFLYRKMHVVHLSGCSNSASSGIKNPLVTLNIFQRTT